MEFGIQFTKLFCSMESPQNLSLLKKLAYVTQNDLLLSDVI